MAIEDEEGVDAKHAQPLKLDVRPLDTAKYVVKSYKINFLHSPNDISSLKNGFKN